MTHIADDGAAVRAILTALGQVIGASAMSALLAEARRANTARGTLPTLKPTITRRDPIGGAAVTHPAETDPLINWLLGFDTLSVGFVAELLRDFGIIASDGHGMLAIHPAAEPAWRALSGQLSPDPLPGIRLTGFDFGPTSQDALRFSSQQSAQHAAALHDRMRD